MSVIGSNIIEIRKELPSTVELVAVSKFKSPEEIMEAYEAGQRIFGESRPQELLQKTETMPKDIEWHFIGHLQTNKIKMTVPYCKLIHSVDSARLLMEIEKFCARTGHTSQVLLEFHIASEETKQGFSREEAMTMLKDIEAAGGLQHVRIRGVMGMASLTDDESLIRSEFAELMSCYEEIKAAGFSFLDAFDIRSFGMTHDYAIAVETGSNMVRIGTRIFGPRGIRL